MWMRSSAVRHSVLYLSRGARERSLRPRDLGQDVRCACSPDERLGIDVVMGDVQIDGQFEFGEHFRGVGTVLRAGRTLSVCSGELHAVQSGREAVVAVMQATMMAVRGRQGLSD